MQRTEVGKYLFMLAGLLVLCLSNMSGRQSNTDHPQLEAYFSSVGPARIFLDGVRPYFVQRSNQQAVLFYDLNSRVRNQRELPELCVVQACFQPDYWVISSHQKDEGGLIGLAGAFSGVVLTSDQFFVATKMTLSCPPVRQKQCLLLNRRK